MYKNYAKKLGVPKKLCHKLLRIMRLTTVLLIASLMQVSATGLAQKITLSEKNAPLLKVFKQIRIQSGYDFIFTTTTLKGSIPVNIKVENADFEDVLKKIFEGQPLEYTVGDKSVIIKQKKEKTFIENLVARFRNIDVSGRVVDDQGNALKGASVTIKGTNRAVITGDNGEFTLSNVDEKAVLVISYLGFEPKEIGAGKDLGFVNMVLRTGKLNEVEVVSTGYQMIPKERATGSFVQLDNALVGRRVSTNILDRLDGITSGVLFNGTAVKTVNVYGSDPRNSGINVRGQSTIYGFVDPLIVVDNFPYEGEINNINPNDIESITVLKDAAAASIWGASAGNGVIVITTKRAKYNEKAKIELNTNITIGNKPDLKYDRNFLNSSDYIDVESYLFKQGYFDDDLSNTFSYPALSPAVSILSKPGSTPAEIQNELDQLRQIDVRDDFSKYIYQKSINQQYSLGMRGGTKDLIYSLSAGMDNNRNNLVRNGFSRNTFNSLATYQAVKNLELTVGLNYSQNKTLQNNTYEYGNSSGAFDLGSYYRGLYPYAQFADKDGNALPIGKDYSAVYISSAKSQGFLDWAYRPLDELNMADNTIKVNDLLMRFSVKYKIIKPLNIEIQYQNEHQVVNGRNYQSQDTYYVRNLINQFAAYDPVTSSFDYVFPLGGIFTTQSYNTSSNNFRGQLNFDQAIGRHTITAIAGAEIRERHTDGMDWATYGYDNDYGTGNSSLNFNTAYAINPSGTNYLPGTPSSFNSVLYRYISYYANTAYTYNDKYTFTLSGRKDGSNIFGVNTNDKVTPLWSAGLGWNISKEGFYQLTWLPYLHLRTTYGFNGNVYSGSAYLRGSSNVGTITGARYIAISQAPNPDLRWEKVKNINLAIDFGTLGNRITGSIEHYRKDGQDLLQPTPLATQTGFKNYTANTASTTTMGTDLTLQSLNLKGKLKWNTTVLLSTLQDRITKYDVKPTSSSIRQNGGIVGIADKPLYSIFSYKWMGLDPANGDPQGYLNGKISKDYIGILNNYNPDSLVYNGSFRPTVYASLRNDFSFKGISLSFNLTYKFGYVFRRSSVNTNYTGVLANYANADYSTRWQKPGDEQHTNVPSLVYPDDTNRSNFYTYSEALIESGDHIRLQDIRAAYDVPLKRWFSKTPFEKLEFYTYANNVGIIWRKNKYKIDPDAYGWSVTHTLPNPFSISFGINAKF